MTAIVGTIYRTTRTSIAIEPLRATHIGAQTVKYRANGERGQTRHVFRATSKADFHDTWEQAHGHLLKMHFERIADLQKQLDAARAAVETLNEMKAPS